MLNAILSAFVHSCKPMFTKTRKNRADEVRRNSPRMSLTFMAADSNVRCVGVRRTTGRCGRTGLRCRMVWSAATGDRRRTIRRHVDGGPERDRPGSQHKQHHRSNGPITRDLTSALHASPIPSRSRYCCRAFGMSGLSPQISPMPSLLRSSLMSPVGTKNGIAVEHDGLRTAVKPCASSSPEACAVDQRHL